MRESYVGLGGNFSQSFSTIQQALSSIASLRGIERFSYSQIYKTSPVSDISQEPFFNAVCRFWCSLSCKGLWKELEKIERDLGKVAKLKNAPRLIDLDLLFFGEMIYYSEYLIVPHPRWHERLFVLAPLADVTDTLPFGIEMRDVMEKFKNPHREEVVVCSAFK